MKKEDNVDGKHLKLVNPKVKLTPEDERRLILANTDAAVAKQGEDQYLDKRSEKKSLIEYFRYNPKKKYIKEAPSTYQPTVPIEFYEAICRLKGWSMDKARNRSPIFAAYTVFILYLRFPKEVISGLRSSNPNTLGFRQYKHFQFLTQIGYENFRGFIQDSVTIMNDCATWSEFVAVYKKKLGQSYQSDLFYSLL